MRNPAQNWDEWFEYAKALTNEDSNVHGSGISYNYAYQIAHIIQRFGGLGVTEEDGAWKANFAGNEGYAAFLNMYKDMIDAGYNPIDADTDPTFTAGQLRMTVTGPWTTGGLDINGINYGIALVPEGMAGPMNSVEVIGFAIANVVSEEEQLAAYRFIEWWNTEDAEGNSPALTWSLENGFPSYAFSVQEKESYKSNEKLVVTSSADPSLPSDFIVDSSFAGANEILNDVILPLMSSITFEDISVEDALLFASMLMTMVRNADIVRIGCQSLIANISSCIMTRRGGEMWKQTIYYPFRLLARHARGTVLEVAGSPACYATPAGARVPEVDVLAMWNRAQGEVAVFCVSRLDNAPGMLELALQGFEPTKIVECVTLTGGARQTNEIDHSAVIPCESDVAVLRGGVLTAPLPPLSFNMIRVRV